VTSTPPTSDDSSDGSPDSPAESPASPPTTEPSRSESSPSRSQSSRSQHHSHRSRRRRRRGSRRTRAFVILGVGLLILVWGAFAARALLDARREAQAGLDALDKARAQLTPQDFLRGGGRQRLTAARVHFAAAHDDVATPLFAPLKLLPFVGRQVRSVEGLSGGATKVLDVSITALTDAKAAVDAAHQPQGAQRIALVRELGVVADDAGAQLDHVSIGPGQNLIGPLQRAHDRFERQLQDLRANVAGLGDASKGFASFLTDSHYLVIAANNSEMRVGSGTYLSLGEMTTKAGHFDLGPMRSATDLMPPQGKVNPAAFDADLAARWGFMKPADDFREVAATSRLDAVAPITLAMWKARTGHTLDGVLVLDPVALRALLHAVGPVVVDGVRYDENNLLQQVFVEQYRGINLDPAQLPQQQRRERLSAIARAAIQRLEHGNWDAVALVDAMRSATLGRHVLLWSKRPVEERGWQGAKLDGQVPADGLMLSIENRAGNKLDQFLPTDATLQTNVAGDGHTDAALTVQMHNVTDLAHGNLPTYVIGPYPRTPHAAAGRYIGWVVAELPGNAYDATMDLDGHRIDDLITAGRDGPDHGVLAALVQIDAGRSATVTVHFRLPKGQRTLELAPTARVLNPALGRPATLWHYGATTLPDTTSHTVHW
jgi:hypothetical protein